MSNRTQRINILVTEAEKEAILAEAASNNLSLSDHIRRSSMEPTFSFGDEELSEAELRIVVSMMREIANVADDINERLDKNHAALQAYRERMNALKKSRHLQKVAS